MAPGSQRPSATRTRKIRWAPAKAFTSGPSQSTSAVPVSTTEPVEVHDWDVPLFPVDGDEREGQQ